MQVWVNDELVGEYRCDLRPGQHVHRVQRIEAPSPLLGGPSAISSAPVAVKTIDLHVVRRSCCVDDIAMRRFGEAEVWRELARHGVPPDAERSSDYQRMQTRYSWHVFDLDLDTYEAIFDDREFEPV